MNDPTPETEERHRAILHPIALPVAEVDFQEARRFTAEEIRSHFAPQRRPQREFEENKIR